MALAKLGLTDDQWLTLAVEISKAVDCHLSGIDQLLRQEQRNRKFA